MLTPIERTAFAMLEKGQFLNGDHPLVVLHAAAEARAEELDALRAKVAALEEAGDGLADELTRLYHTLAIGDVKKIRRWREVREG